MIQISPNQSPSSSEPTSQAERSIRALKDRIARTDRTDVSGFDDAAIDVALTYIEVSPELKDLADKTRGACRRFLVAFHTPIGIGATRRQRIEQKRARALECLAKLEAVVARADESWVAQMIAPQAKPGAPGAKAETEQRQ